MKKVLCGVVAVVMMLCLTACGNTCNEQNCSQQKVPGFDYCSTHKCCHYYNCNEDRIKKSNFCAKHTCAHPGCYEAVSVVCGQESRYCGRHQDDENQSCGGSNDSYKNDENLCKSEKETLLGYWLGTDYWNHGYITEATQECIRHAFEDLDIQTIWCGNFSENKRSARVQEKCGFIYYQTSPSNLTVATSL